MLFCIYFYIRIVTASIYKAFAILKKYSKELIEIAAKCIKLELARPPEFISCAVGEPADISNLYINAIFDDGSRDTLHVNYKMFSEHDLNTVGEQRKSTVSYAEQTLDVIVPLRNARLERIEAVPKKPLVYKSGQTFVKDDIIVTAYYSDNSSRVIQNYKCSPFYSIKPDTKEIKIRYGVCKTVIPVEIMNDNIESDTSPAKTDEHNHSLISEKKIIAVSVAKRPDRQQYLIGDVNVDLSGGKLDLIYSDGSAGQINMLADGDVFIDSTSAGQSKVTFEFLGMPVSFSVEILKPQIMKLYVDRPPLRTDYTEGDILDLTGLVLEAVYNDGSVRPINGLQSNGYIVSLADNEQGVTLAYDGYPFVVKINVVALPKEIRIVDVFWGKLPKKVEYIERETEKPNLMGAELIVQMSDGCRKSVVVTEDMITQFNIDTQGKAILEITYEGRTVSCPIIIHKRSLLNLECDSTSTKHEYFENERFDLKGIALYALYDNGEKEVITDYTVDKDRAAIGDTSVILSYGGYSISYPISVNPLDNKMLLGLNVCQYPKTDYYEGEKFSPDGLVVEALYAGDISKVVEVSYTPSESLKASDKHVLICYEDKAVMLPIKVKNKEDEQAFDCNTKTEESVENALPQEEIEPISDIIEELKEEVSVENAKVKQSIKENIIVNLPSFYPSSFNVRFEYPPDDYAF